MQEEAFLKELLDDDTDIVRKNELALYLSDKKDERLVPILENLISNPKYKDCRGTFVYALKNFSNEKRLNLLIDLLINANYEVAHEAVDIINSIKYLEGAIVYQSYKKLENALENCDKSWREELIKEVLSCFE